MSLEFRESVAAAASTVEGVNCHAYYWQGGTAPGSSMVRLDRINRDSSGFGYMATWAVWVVLPQGLETAEKWLDSNVPALVSALSSVLVVSAVTPQTFVLGNSGQVPGIAIEGSAEYEMEA